MAPIHCRRQALTDAPALSPDDLRNRVGTELGLSRWVEMDQPRIDTFAACTEDDQFIHIDPVRAADTPFGGTVAHGFLSLAMLSALSYDALPDVAGFPVGVNYGFDRIRFVSPVRSGARIRGRFVLAEVDFKQTAITLHLDVTVEIEHADRPAIVARWITRHIP